MKATIDPPSTLPPSVLHLAEVESVEDVGSTGKIKVRLLSYDAVPGQDGPILARLCVPFAGKDRGAFLVPDVKDEVLVAFINQDPRQAVVVGGLWSGQRQPKESLGGSGKAVDRWTLVGKKGTRIAIIEESDGQATIELSTPGNVSAKLSQSSGGSIELSAAGSSLTIDSQGVTIDTSSSFTVSASAGSDFTCPQMNVTTGQAAFSGVVQCTTSQATTVVSGTYTPGAGNVW